MRSQAGAGIRWLRRLWRSEQEPGGSAVGESAVRPVEPLLGAVETLICEGVVHRAGVATSADRARRLEPSGPAPWNVFGRPVQEEVAGGAREALTVATGMSLAGLRSTAFVAGDQLGACHGALQSASTRLVPLVLHVAHGDAGHAGYHAVADSGCFQLLASSGQDALDLTLVARWLTERALVPGVVATDGEGVESLALLDEATMRAYLGAPHEPIASPTEAQRILFGNERARMFRWFDPDRPVATGGVRNLHEQARAQLGDQIFFRDPVADLARQGMRELARLTGRPVSFLRSHRMEDADVVLVAQGASVQVAQAVADFLRESGRQKVGVLGVTWLRPFPARELADALAGRRDVAVIELVDDRLAHQPPLFKELAAAVGGGPGWISVTASAPAPDPVRLAGVCELLRSADRPRALRIDQVGVPETTAFPRRDALLQSVANASPSLRESALPGAGRLEFDPGPVRSAALVGLEAELPPDALQQLGDAVAAEAGPQLRGSVTRPAPGVWQARVRAAPAGFSDPGPRAPVDLLLVAGGSPDRMGQPLTSLRPGGTLLLARDDPPAQLWAALPDPWQLVIRERGLRVLSSPGTVGEGLDALGACLRGEQDERLAAGTLRQVTPDAGTVRATEAAGLPGVVRRIARARTAHDSLPRFWGEIVQPGQSARPDELPDPLSASSAVPAGASALAPEPGLCGIPLLDTQACTGCGRCWSACPESAIGVTSLPLDALLTGASHAAGTSGSAADALRRAHKALAGRLAGQLRKSDAGQLRRSDCDDAWTWLSERLDLSEEDRPDHQTAFQSTAEQLLRLEPVVTELFFHAAEEQTKGGGELLVLAFDPRSCVGCNLCVAECPEDALHLSERSPQLAAEHAARWRAWEQLPDTPGATLARAARDPEVGPLAATLLSRHCAQTQVSGADGEPGSGERLASRLVVAMLEQHAQRRLAGIAKRLEEQRDALDSRARERLAEGLSATDLDTLVVALGSVGSRAGLSDLGQQLDSLGAQARFDRPAVLRMARLAAELEELRDKVVEGVDGLGRARFGVVVAQGSVADWAARYPLHPYYAPLTLAPTAQGVELARGIARGLVAEHLELLRCLRRAELEVEAPADREARLERIDSLAWQDLDPEEQAACPPLVLLGDETALLDQGFGALTRVLTSDLPLKVVLLDGRGRLDPAPEPALVAMSLLRSFVLCSSPAYPDHLASGVADALDWPGPALLHLHAPSPLRHGFHADQTLARARSAVESRAHVLFRYDPAAEGLFGLRASLDGNPGMDLDWSEHSFVAWAAGESRFAEHLCPAEQQDGPSLDEWEALPSQSREEKRPIVEIGERRFLVAPRLARAAVERRRVWNTLRELTGAAGPFTDRIRSALEQEIRAEFEAKIEALSAEHVAREADLAAGTDAKAIGRLRERLLTLAGYGAKNPPGGDSP